MSGMESGEDIHLERTTGCQPSVTPSFIHDNCDELLAQVGPTVSSITEGNQSTHEPW